MGFTAFPVPRARSPGGVRVGIGAFPAVGSHPSKSFPRQQPRRITATLAVVPLPLRRRHGTSRDARCRTPQPVPPRRNSRLHGLAPLTSPLQFDAVSSAALPVPSMGFFPLQGPRTLRSSPGKPGSAPVQANRRRQLLGAHRRGESRRERPRWHPSKSLPPCRGIIRECGEPDGAVLPKSVRSVWLWSAIRFGGHRGRPPKRTVAMRAPRGWLH